MGSFCAQKPEKNGEWNIDSRTGFRDQRWDSNTKNLYSTNNRHHEKHSHRKKDIFQNDDPIVDDPITIHTSAKHASIADASEFSVLIEKQPEWIQVTETIYANGS